MMLGTVSYLSNDEKDREFRWKQAKKSIAQFSEIASWVNKPLYVVTTNWTEENRIELMEYIKQTAKERLDGRTIHFIETPMSRRGCNISKNTLLRLLYESEEDYLFMADDDTWIYPHYEIRKFFEQVEKHPEHFYDNGVYIILSVYANVSPYKEKNMNDKDFTKNWVFENRVVRDVGYPALYINTRKHFGKDALAPEFDVPEQNYYLREDLCRLIEMIKLGCVPYYLTSFISSTVDFWKASAIRTLASEEENLKYVDRWANQLIDLYPKVTRYKNRWVNYDGYLPVRYKKRVLVPREQVYNFVAKDFVKKRPRKEKKGLLRK